MSNPAETLHLPRSAGADEGQGALLVGTIQGDAAFSAGGDAGRMRQAVRVVPPGGDKGQARSQSIEKLFRTGAAAAMVGELEQSDRLRQAGGAKALEPPAGQVAGEEHALAAGDGMHEDRAIIRILGLLRRHVQVERTFPPPSLVQPSVRQ